MNWLNENTIYVTLHGSQAYGLANEFSDTDVKGICIPPREVEYHLYHRFEQAENSPDLEKKLEHLKNPKNPKFESTIYSLRKFFLLAAEVNPNIIELLWTDPKHHFISKFPMDKIIENRNLFLSNKARYTFAGYAVAQAKKIERHRKWIVLGEVKPPTREQFGLPTVEPKGVEEVRGYMKSKVEQWNLNQFPIDEMLRAELKDNIWELLTNVSGREISVANWPDEYHSGVLNQMKLEWNLKDEVVAFINAERAYSKAKQVYDSWVSWKKERNPARRALEEKSGYDTKHASHLVRLMRMGYEILSEGKVIVNREGIDADELLAIKNGAWDFDKVMEYKNEMETKLDVEYARQKKLIAEGKPVPLAREVNKEKLNTLYHELYEDYWNKELFISEFGKSPYE
jgi:predicted nucleotidyltransferase